MDDTSDRLVDGASVLAGTEGLDSSEAKVETILDRFDAAIEDSIVLDEGNSSLLMELLGMYTGMLANGVDMDGGSSGVHVADSVVHVVGFDVGPINDVVWEAIELSNAVDGGGGNMEPGAECVVE